MFINSCILWITGAHLISTKNEGDIFMERFKKLLCLVVTLIIISSSFVGCSKKTDNDDNKDASKKSNEPITLTYWVPMHGSATKIMKSYSENEVYKELEKRTGVHIEFVHPASGQANEQFNVMIASEKLPDMISQFTEKYPGGVDKAIDDGIYLKLNDLIDKNAPNFKKIRESNPEIVRQTITDAGNIWAFPCIQTTLEEPWRGLLIRKDWLDDLGLEVPTTIDEWYTVLKAFKEKKNAEAPLLMPKEGYDWGGAFLGAYDIGYEFYKRDDKVNYAFTEPGFKEYLITMNKWYKEGLIDKDFATRDDKSFEALITSGKAGAFIGAYEHIDFYGNIIKSTDPKAELVAAPYPSLKPGEAVHYRQKDEYNKGCPTVVTTSCQKPEEAVKWLDYAYGNEGTMLFNYGVENVSYKMESGKPVFTELITKNPDGLAYSILSWKYKLHMGPYLRDWKAFPTYDKVKPAMETWAKAGVEYVLPPLNLTDEESREFSSKINEINTYKNEKILKLILGAEPINKFDEYTNQINKMGLDDVVKIKQDALDRYNRR